MIFSDKEKQGVYLEIICNISNDHSYSLEITPPLLISECTMKAWYEGNKYGMIDVDYACRVEIRWVKTGGSKRSSSKSKC